MGDRIPDERSPSPWESSSKANPNQELADLKARQRQLGESVSWIVDVLRADEPEQPESTNEADKQSRRRSEALTSLAYVRDALQGDIETLDVGRLFVGVEGHGLTERKALPVEHHSTASPLPTPTTSTITSAPPSYRSFRSPVANPASELQTPRGMARLPATGTPFMPSFHPSFQPSTQPPSPPESFSPPALALSPNEDATQLAAWKPTSRTNPPLRAPESVAQLGVAHPSQPTPTPPSRQASPLPPILPTASKSSLSDKKTNRRLVEDDPLGALG
jgi:TBC1 domain family protein 5